MYQVIEDCGVPTWFSILPHPVYQPKYGSIEYKIYDSLLHMQYNTVGETSIDEMGLVNNTPAVLIGPFNSIFDHCGYSINGLYD